MTREGQAMNHGLVSTEGQGIFHNITRPNISHPRTKSMPEPCPRLTFSMIHVPKPTVFLKKQTRSRRTRPIEATAVSTMCTATTESFYGLLGIAENGTIADIKQAYKQLARKYHPDVSPPDLREDYTKRFIEVQEAYETLSDPDRRASYDRYIAAGLHMVFSARKGFRHKEVCDERNEWRNQWESQLAELERKRTNKDTVAENMSWAARIRMQRNQKTDSNHGL